MVAGSRTKDLVAELKVRDHVFVSGVSEKIGGHDEGASPHELIEAALTACTILTAQMYANRKGIPLVSTDVRVQIVSEGAETKISREVSYRGDLTEEQKTRLTEIVNKCPIHKLLESKITIDTTII